MTILASASRRRPRPHGLGLVLLVLFAGLLSIVVRLPAAQEVELQHTGAEAAAALTPSKSPSEQASIAEAKKRSLQEALAYAGRRALDGGLPGAVAGALQVLCLMPLRTASNYQHRYGCSLAETIAILMKQGGLARFYEGLSFALLQGPLARFGATAANDGVRALLQSMELTRDLPLVVATAVAAVVAGCWRIFLMPLDTLKTVSQVQGTEGFRAIMRRLALSGHISPLYQGAMVTAVSAALGHFPWFTTHNYLNACLPRPPAGSLFLPILRNGFIGFVAAAVADVVTNAVRVVKTTKQAVASVSSITYADTIQVILAADGYRGLFGRGLGTRIMTNGLQSIVFTILWEALRPPDSAASFHGKEQQISDGKGPVVGGTDDVDTHRILLA